MSPRIKSGAAAIATICGYLAALCPKLLVRMDRILWSRGWRSFETILASDLDDETFVRNVYREILHREVDSAGLEGALYALRCGKPRTSLLLQITSSDEFLGRLRSLAPAPKPLPNLVAKWPQKYRRQGEFLLFEVGSPVDYDLLEARIISDGYYERIGNWAYDLNPDHRLLARMIALLGPHKVLELGCGVGGVLRSLLDQGVDCIGLDISTFSRSRAVSGVADRILVGDLLHTKVSDSAIDLICGFDFFEHLNPNKLESYFAQCVKILPKGGLLLLNVPAFGNDDVYGLVHGYWIEQWREACANHVQFRDIPCDETGFPLMGHLVWADSTWWERTMAAHGLIRLRDCERLLHQQFDKAMAYSDARRSYFLMMNSLDEQKEARLKENISAYKPA